MKRLACLLISAALTGGCAGNPERFGKAQNMVEDATPEAGSDEPVIMAALPVRLDLTFSPALIQALDAGSWKLALRADLYGKPGAAASPAEQSGGSVPLGEEAYELATRDQSVTLAGRFDAARLARLVSGEPRVRVTLSVTGSEPTRPEIYCSGFDEALPLLAETGGHIHCELFER